MTHHSGLKQSPSVSSTWMPASASSAMPGWSRWRQARPAQPSARPSDQLVHLRMADDPALPPPVADQLPRCGRSSGASTAHRPWRRSAPSWKRTARSTLDPRRVAARTRQHRCGIAFTMAAPRTADPGSTANVQRPAQRQSLERSGHGLQRARPMRLLHVTLDIPKAGREAGNRLLHQPASLPADRPGARHRHVHAVRGRRRAPQPVSMLSAGQGRLQSRRAGGAKLRRGDGRRQLHDRARLEGIARRRPPHTRIECLSVLPLPGGRTHRVRRRHGSHGQVVRNPNLAQKSRSPHLVAEIVGKGRPPMVSGFQRCGSFLAIVLGLTFGTVSATDRHAVAQTTFPERTVRFIVPSPPGTMIDLLPRMLGETLSVRWGRPVIVENRSGAAHNIGADVVARAEPDGHTLLVTPPAPIVLTPWLCPKRKLASREPRAGDSVDHVPPGLDCQSKSAGKVVRGVDCVCQGEPGSLELRFARSGDHGSPRSGGTVSSVGESSWFMCRTKAWDRR